MTCTDRHPREGLCPDCGYTVLPTRWTLRGRMRCYSRVIVKGAICLLVGHLDQRRSGVLGCARCWSRKVFRYPVAA